MSFHFIDGSKGGVERGMRGPRRGLGGSGHCECDDRSRQLWQQQSALFVEGRSFVTSADNLGILSPSAAPCTITKHSPGSARGQ